MRGPFFVNSKSVMFKWLLSYISVLIIPLMVSGVVYTYFSSELRYEINNANTALLRQVKNDMDNKLQDMRRLSTQIGLNHQLRMLIAVDGAKFSAGQYNRLMQDFRVFRVANGAVDDFFILLPDREIALTPSTVLHEQLYQDLIGRFTLLGQNTLETLLRQRQPGGFIPVRQTVYGGQQRDLIAWLQSLPVDKNGPPAGSLLILMDPAQLTKTLDNIRWIDEGVVLVLDEQDHVIASSEPFSLPDSLRYSNLTDEGVSYSCKDGETAYTVAHAVSGVTGWKYVSVIPDAIFWKKSDAIRYITLCSVAISLVLGGVLAWLFVRSNYVPVRKLVGVLAEKAGIDFDQRHNEFRFIEEALSSAFGQRQADSQALDRQLLHLRRSFIARLMKGNLELSTPVQEALDLYDIRFVSDDFCVLLFYVNALTSDVLKGAKQDELSLSRYIVRNVFEELFNRTHYGMIVTVDDLQALLLNVSPGCADLECEIDEALREGMVFVEEKFGISLSVSKSTRRRSFEEIPNAYTEAYTAMEYNILMGKTGITDYSEIVLGLGGVNNSYFYYYPLKVEVQFTNFIKSGDYNNAKRILNELFDINFNQCHLPGTIVRCFMFNLTSTMMKTIYELEDMASGEPVGMEEVDRLLNCQTVAEMDMEMNKLLIRLCEYARQKAHIDGPVQRAASIIRNGYSDATLSLAQIAERVGITPSYLSKKFREDTGLGVPEFVNKVRVEAAKHLLLETHKPILEIAELCGFVNDNMLIRAFKKQEGVTPGKYRQMNARDDLES